MGSPPNGCSLVSTKTSRPYEMDIHLGRYPIQLERWSATRRAKRVPNQYRDACERRHFSHPTKRLFRQEQTRSSILSCNPGPGTIEEHCKEYISNYRKLATNSVYLKHEQQHEQWGQAWHKLHQQQVHDHLHAQVAQPVSTHLERAVLFHLLMSCHMHLMAQGVLESHLIRIVIHVRFSLTSPSSLSTSTWPSPSFSTSPSSCTRAAHWARQPDHHATQPAHLREKGSNDAYDVHTSLTGYEHNFTAFSEPGDSQGSFSCNAPSSDLDIDDAPLGKLLTDAHREHADYCDPEGVSVSQSSLSVVFDWTGKPVGERNVDQSTGFGVTRNTYSAHSKFSENTQAEKMVDRTGNPVGENSSNAQIRTLFDEQRQMIIAEYCEKIGHHELQAARAEEERRILQEELWRQQIYFREVHQQSLTEMEELRKFKSSTFDTLARRKLIEDQNTIMELSGRVHELQNEVNCMKDSKDFQDAESGQSGNPHVTKSTYIIPWTSCFWRIIEAFIRIAAPQRRAAMHLGFTWYIGKRFCKSTCFFFSSLSSRIESMEDKHWGTASHVYCGEKWKTRTKSRLDDASQDLQPKIHSSSVEETLQRIMGQTNNDCRFLISTLTSSLHQQPLLAGRKVQDRGMYLFTISIRKQYNGSRNWSWLIQWTI